MQNNKNKLIYFSLFQFIFCLFLVFLSFIYSLTLENDEYYIYPLCIIGLLSFAWMLVSFNILQKTLIHPYSLFITAAILFNGGQIILEVFFLNADGFLWNRVSAGIQLRAIYFTVLGLSFLHFGALCSLLFSSSESKEGMIQRSSRNTSVSVTGWTLFGLSVIPTMYDLIMKLKLVMSSGYFSLYLMDRQTGVSENLDKGITDLFSTSLLFILAGSKGRKFDVYVSTISICLVSGINLFMGSRGLALMSLIAFGWLFHSHIKPIPRTIWLGGGTVIFVIILPLVRLIRNISGDSRVSTEFLLQSYLSIKNPLTAILSEMGGSILTTAYTLQFVPLTKEFDWGFSYLYAIRFITPNSWWDFQREYTTLSNWLVWTAEPSTASVGGGLGYSFIAEAYYNFGWGGIIVLALFGAFVGYLSNWALKDNDPIKVAMIACVLSFLLLYSRAETINITRSLFWYAYVPYIIASFLSKLRAK